MNVLVVEDQTVVREMLAAVVSSSFRGAQVHAAAGLEEGLAAAQATRMDLVLLDLGLPGCQGIDSVTRFKAAFPQALILVVSSNDDGRVISEALRSGASGFIPKALTPAGIAAVLRGAAGHARQPAT